MCNQDKIRHKTEIKTSHEGMYGQGDVVSTKHREDNNSSGKNHIIEMISVLNIVLTLAPSFV